jgi:hypothetical protein
MVEGSEVWVICHSFGGCKELWTFVKENSDRQAYEAVSRSLWAQLLGAQSPSQSAD